MKKAHLLGACFCLLYGSWLFATANELGMSRDESFYVDAAEHYARWFARLLEGQTTALQRSEIDAAWARNHEHPPVAKSLFALSWLAQQRWQLFPNDSLAHRAPAIVLAALMPWLTLVFGARFWSVRCGIFAALTLMLAMPRLFYHSHLNCFDVPIAFLMLWTTYTYLRAFSNPKWFGALALSFGLALATKHNSWMLPGVFATHHLLAWALTRVPRRSHPTESAQPNDRRSCALAEAPLSAAPSALLPFALVPRRGWRRWLPPGWAVAMILGSSLLVALWPWLWHDTLQRLNRYGAFHLRHDYYNMAFFGTNYFRPPFPWTYPFVMTAFTVSLTPLVMAALGTAHSLGRILKRQWRPSQPELLALGALAAPILAIALPSSPIFGGTKHWFPAYPFLAIFAGLGFDIACEAVYPLSRHMHRSVGTVARLALGAIALLPGTLETLHSHPFGLSHYTALAGGPPGAATLGMNRQFWGYTTRSMLSWIRRALPKGGTIWLCDTTAGAWRMLQRDGLVPDNIRPTPWITHADVVLVHHEHHFAEVEGQAQVATAQAAPDYVLSYDGVPIISAYKSRRLEGQAGVR